MKKQFELRHIAILALFLAGLILMILGNKSKYCLGFGMISLGCALLLYSIEKVREINQRDFELSQDFSEYQGSDIFVLEEYNRQTRLYRKQSFRTRIVFYLFAGLLIVLGIISMI